LEPLMQWVFWALSLEKCGRGMMITPIHSVTKLRMHGNITDSPIRRGTQQLSWGIMLQAGRSQDRVPMKLLDFSIYLILPAALWPWDRLSL
jgi:hypothetical protein